MDFIYDHIKELLAAVPAIRWTDLDKGQLDNYNTRPAVPFPCALLRINVNRTEDIGGGKQKCFATVVVRLGFEFMGDTDSHVPDVALAESLQYFQVNKATYRAIQNQSSKKHSPFSRSATEQEVRDDGIIVINMPFNVNYTEDLNA